MGGFPGDPTLPGWGAITRSPEGGQVHWCKVSASLPSAPTMAPWSPAAASSPPSSPRALLLPRGQPLDAKFAPISVAACALLPNRCLQGSLRRGFTQLNTALWPRERPMAGPGRTSQNQRVEKLYFGCFGGMGDGPRMPEISFVALFCLVSTFFPREMSNFRPFLLRIFIV